VAHFPRSRFWDVCHCFIGREVDARNEYQTLKVGDRGYSHVRDAALLDELIVSLSPEQDKQ
jgi:hypothetical protein